MSGWIAYALAWLVAAGFWALAYAYTGDLSPLDGFPWGVLIMGSAGLMGVGVWHLTGRVPLNWLSPAFYLPHAISMAVYATVYSTVFVVPDILQGRAAEAIATLRNSPAIIWNVLMGGGLYLTVAALSYAIRAQQRARVQEAAAAEARLLAQQAQLAAIRARLNPHFLFNALHSVGALVPHDPVRADQAIECLGDLLRYTLGTEDQVMFSQEWRFTQDYLAFEQLRLGDRLRIDAQAEPHAMTIPVPPLILQPLVENAVRHGIADREDGGRIELRAGVRDNRLVLRVADDGDGRGAAGSDGLGLTSVRQRLHTLYGDAASIEIDRGSAGYAVTMGVPCIPPAR